MGHCNGIYGITEKNIGLKGGKIEKIVKIGYCEYIRNVENLG